jgi:hypothetical protein
MTVCHLETAVPKDNLMQAAVMSYTVPYSC